MKLTITREHFRAALEVAAPVVKPRSTLPVLTTVLLSATPDGGVVVSGTDLETRAWHTVEADVTEAGGVCLPPDRLRDFLASLDDGAVVTVSADEQHKAELRSGASRTRIAGIDQEQFPAAPLYDAPSYEVTIAAEAFCGLIRGVAHAVAPDESRPVLAGVLIQSDGSTLQAVAADGFRLAMAAVPAEAPAVSVIAAGKALGKAIRTVSGASSVRLVVDQRRSSLLLDSAAGCWSVRLIDGQFPDFNRVIPREYAAVVTLDRAAMMRALGLVKGVESTDTGYRVRVAFGDGEATVSAGSATADQEAETVIPCVLESGKAITVAYNTRYFGEAVEAVDGERVTLEIGAVDRPCVVRAAGAPTGSRQIVMPMSLAR